MRFSIVTPSFRQIDWLKFAARSVADQGVELEHLVQDGGSGEELAIWANSQALAQVVSERDNGMYDALNRGFARAHGDVWAWLNCDEQYLPGALAAVAERFASDPDLDVLLADHLVVDANGSYLAHRFAICPTLAQLWVRFPVSSCAMFFRPRVWAPFDTRWKSSGDWWWYRAMIARGARVGVLRRFVAAFTETQANLGLSEVTVGEMQTILAARPWWAKWGGPVLLAMHRWRMWRSGTFSVKPFRYALHTRDTMERREFVVDRPTARWRRPPVGSHGQG